LSRHSLEEEEERVSIAAREEGKLRRSILILQAQLTSPEEWLMMAEPIRWRPEIPDMDLRQQIRYLKATLA
jgi:hypothetical protein